MSEVNSSRLADSLPGRRSLFGALQVMLVFAALFGSRAGAICSTTDSVNLDPIPERIRRDAVASVRLEPIARGLVAPNWGTAAPGDTRRLFVVDTVGRLWVVDLETRVKRVVLDVSGLIVPLGESGLLGVALHPDFLQNGLLYTYTTEPYLEAESAEFPIPNLAPGVLPRHRSVVTEWTVSAPASARPLVDPASRRVLLRIDQPQGNHNGGALVFGPDRMLYIALGDGGGAADRDDGHHPVFGNGQDRATVLGKILRIDPRAGNARNGQYGVPLSNPYAPRLGRKGGAEGCADGFCDEIWAYGFRNPFRIAFDRLAGGLFAADVGQGKIEEIDLVRAGGNYGWRFKEGRFFFRPPSGTRSFISDVNCLGVPASDLIDPVAQYDHDEGQSVIGGYVYRGSELPALQGRYVFGDLVGVSPRPGRLLYFNAVGLVKRPDTQRTIRELRIAGRSAVGYFIFGFGQDAAGELYVMGNATGSPTLTDAGPTGIVFKLSAPVMP